MKPARRVVLALAALATAGCRIGDLPAPEPLPAVLAGDPVLGPAREAEPLPYRVGVAPIRIAFEPEALHADDAARHGAAPDPTAVRRALIEALQAGAPFRRVSARGAGDATAEAVRADAWSAHDDLLLQVDVRGYYQAYLGHANYLWWLFLYTGGVWPGFFVPVDRYGVGIEAHVRLGSVQSNVALLDTTYRVRPGDVPRELTPLERELAGFLDLGALWSVETSLDESNWAAIDRWVAPHAWRRVHVELLRDIERILRAPLAAGTPDEQEQVLRRVRKRFALAVGVGHFQDPQVGVAPNADRDAEAMAEFWASEAGGGLVRDRDLLVLQDATATRAGVLDAIAAIGSRVTASDEVVISIAGIGATVTAGRAREGYLLLHDAKARDLPGTGLSLAALGDAIRALPAERVVVFVDASFAGRSGARTLPAAAGGVPPASVRAALRLRAGHAVVLAADPRQGALALPDAEAGLFTHVLLAGLAGRADSDGDGRVLLDELVGFARREVRGRAVLEGANQRPEVFWTGPVAMGWPR